MSDFEGESSIGLGKLSLRLLGYFCQKSFWNKPIKLEEAIMHLRKKG